MKFVQFHRDNTNSTSVTKKYCVLTFLEPIFPKLNSQIANFNYKNRSICHGFTVTSNSTNSRSEFDRENIKPIISHHLAEFFHFLMNLTIEIGAFPNFMLLLLKFTMDALQLEIWPLRNKSSEKFHFK
jgi:hypothetical protein